MPPLHSVIESRPIGGANAVAISRGECGLFNGMPSADGNQRNLSKSPRRPQGISSGRAGKAGNAGRKGGAAFANFDGRPRRRCADRVSLDNAQIATYVCEDTSQ